MCVCGVCVWCMLAHVASDVCMLLRESKAGGSGSRPLRGIGLGVKQLPVERGEAGAHRVGVAVAEGLQLLHVLPAQRAQQRHPLVKLERER